MQQIEADYYVSDFAANPVALPAIKLSAKPAPTDCADPAAVFEDGVPATSAGPMRPDHVHQVSKVMEEAIAESRKQRRAVIRLFGVTEHGNSVAMHVHNFLPYFYVPAWRGLTVASLQEFKDALNQRVLTDSRERGITSAILGVEVVRKKSIWGFHRENSDFIKIILALPTLVPSAVRLLGQGVPIGNGQTQAFTTYESNVSSDKTFVLRYMIDISTAGGSWVEAPGRAYAVRGAENTKLTTCQLEVDIDARHIIAHESAGRWLKMAPLRVLSYDIECAGRRGFFPTPDQDSVIQIASVVALSENLNKPLHKCVHTLNTCASIAGAEIVSRMTEPEMLQAWSDHFRDVDPDVITGYNMVNFDMPYLIDRAKTLKLGARFAQFTRIKDLESTVRNTTFSSGALGKQENKETNMEGRIQFDVLVALRREYNLRSYSLNAVSAEFLKQQKEDVHHSIITDLQNGTDETRKRLAVYCLKDAVLPLRLMQKLMFLVNYVEMARVTGVPLMYLLTRGQSIKVISQILRKAKQHDLIVPVVKKGGNDDNYEGATVLDPKQGYYSTPIATLDFASLYPSIMMAHNLCYTTMVSSADAAKMPAGDAHRTPNGDWFVNQKVARGVLPEILEELLSARKAARKEMASAKDPFTKAVLNGRQLALKISANSVYGFTGAQVGQLPCLAISSSVTGYGREMIEHTKNTVEKIYTKANGYEHDAVVIYGDTDSVMVKFGTEDIKEAMRLGVEAAGLVSKEFISPIRLEFEKVYWPYLLLNRKRYAGLYWTNPNKWDKIDAKGIETVRRDNCGLVKKLFSECLDMILVRRSPDLAVAHVKRVISDLLCNKMDLSLLVISKSLGKGASADDYDAKQVRVISIYLSTINFIYMCFYLHIAMIINLFSFSLLELKLFWSLSLFRRTSSSPSACASVTPRPRPLSVTVFRSLSSRRPRVPRTTRSPRTQFGCWKTTCRSTRITTSRTSSKSRCCVCSSRFWARRLPATSSPATTRSRSRSPRVLPTAAASCSSQKRPRRASGAAARCPRGAARCASSASRAAQSSTSRGSRRIKTTRRCSRSSGLSASAARVRCTRKCCARRAIAPSFTGVRRFSLTLRRPLASLSALLSAERATHVTVNMRLAAPRRVIQSCARND